MSKHDVIIIGGGVAGCSAAIAAAREGARVLLIERYGFLGGWATAALVNPFMTHKASDGKPLVAGIFDEIRDGLQRLNGLLANSFDSEALKFALQEMVLESGANLRLHSYVLGAAYTDDGDIELEICSKSGVQKIRCRRLIDCSGDGDAAYSLGAQFNMGGEDGWPQAMTLMFDMGGVDVPKALEYIKNNPESMSFPKLPPDADVDAMANDVYAVAGYFDLVAQARFNGEYSAPGDMIFYISRPRKGEVVFNTTHAGHVRGTDADDLTHAEIECRRQMMSIVAFVRKYVPGFERSYLLQSAPQIGVRETRRIVGEYVFEAQDVISGRKFDDAICRLAYMVDVHSGKGDGYTKDEDTGPGLPPPGDWYEIPYRCLVPKSIENVLVAGRCVSSTQAGHGAIRIMPACIAMGQAAGTAAAMSIDANCSPRNIDISQLLVKLRNQGALVGK